MTPISRRIIVANRTKDPRKVAGEDGQVFSYAAAARVGPTKA